MTTYPLVWSGLVGSPRKFEIGAQLVLQDVATKGAATATCTFDLYVRSPNSIDEVGDLYWSASTSSGWDTSGYLAPLVQVNNSQAPIGQITIEVPITSRKPLDWYVWVGMDGIGAAGFGSMAELDLDGYIPYSAPATPTSVTASRISDTSTALSWTLPQDDAERVESVVIRRWDAASNVTRTIRTLNYYATSYTDRSTVANNRYLYMVQALNRSAVGEPGSSNYISTKPGPPGSVSAGRTVSGDVQVSWVNAMRAPGVTEVWDNPNGNYAATVKVGEVAWPGSSWTGAASTAQTHVYYLKHRTSDLPVLTSDDSPDSNLVGLPSPPFAPSGIGPAVMDPADLTPIVWTHQTADTTGQQAFEVQYRETGTSTWTTTGKQTSTVQQWATPGTGIWAPGVTVDVQVRTWGVHADPGPWSPTHVVALDAKPVATVVAPTGVVNASLVTVELAYFDAEATSQSAAEVQLLDDSSAVVETVAVDGAGTSAPLTTRLADGANYTIRARVRDGAGLWSDWAASAITVTYLPPPTPAATAVWVQDSGAVDLTMSYVEPAGAEVSAMLFEIWRDGTLIASGLAPEPGAPVVLVDPIPPTSGVTYEFVAWSNLPSSATTTITLPADPVIRSRAWWNAGPGWSIVAAMGSGVQIGHDVEVASDTEHYSGRERPVTTYGEAVSEELSVSGRMYAAHGEDPAVLQQIATARTVACYRDPWTRQFVRVGRVSTGRAAGRRAVEVSVPMTVTAYEE